MIPPDDLIMPQWKPVIYERRWHVARRSGGHVERSVESFGNRSTALVVAETLNGEERSRIDKVVRQMLRPRK